jgi:hypothetical protein
VVADASVWSVVGDAGGDCAWGVGGGIERGGDLRCI